MTTEIGMVNQSSEVPPDRSVVRQTARERRMAWARRRLVPPSAEWAPRQRRSTATPVETPFAFPRNRRGWSVNVEQVDRERLVRGWTQRELARRACVDQGTLSDLLARRRRPTLGTVQAICTALGLALAHVIVFDPGDK